MAKMNNEKLKGIIGNATDLFHTSKICTDVTGTYKISDVIDDIMDLLESEGIDCRFNMYSTWKSEDIFQLAVIEFTKYIANRKEDVDMASLNMAIAAGMCAVDNNQPGVIPGYIYTDNYMKVYQVLLAATAACLMATTYFKVNIEGPQSIVQTWSKGYNTFTRLPEHGDKYRGKGSPCESIEGHLAHAYIREDAFKSIFLAVDENVEKVREFTKYGRTDNRTRSITTHLSSELPKELSEDRIISRHFTSNRNGLNWIRPYESVSKGEVFMEYAVENAFIHTKKSFIRKMQSVSRSILGPLVLMFELDIDVNQAIIDKIARRSPWFISEDSTSVIINLVKSSYVIEKMISLNEEEMVDYVGCNNELINRYLRILCHKGERGIFDTYKLIVQSGLMDRIIKRADMLVKYKQFPSHRHNLSGILYELFGDSDSKHMESLVLLAGKSPITYIDCLLSELGETSYNDSERASSFSGIQLHRILAKLPTDMVQRIHNEFTRENQTLMKIYNRIMKSGKSFMQGFLLVIELFAVYDKSLEWILVNIFSTKAIEFYIATSGATDLANNIFQRNFTRNNIARSIICAHLGSIGFMEYIGKFSIESIHNYLDGNGNTAMDGSVEDNIPKARQLEYGFSHINRLNLHMKYIRQMINISKTSVAGEFWREFDEHTGDKASLIKFFEHHTALSEATVFQDLTGTLLKDTMQKRIDIVEVESSNSMYVHFHKHDDPEVLKLGELTNCCQTIGGAAESSIVEGTMNPYSGFISVRNKDNNQVVAQAWIWLTDDKKTLVLDSIESRRIDKQMSLYSTTICEWAKGQKYNIAIGSQYTKLDKAIARQFGFEDTSMTHDTDMLVIIPEDESTLDPVISSVRKQLLGSKYQHMVFDKVLRPGEQATRVIGNVYSDAMIKRFILQNR